MCFAHQLERSAINTEVDCSIILYRTVKIKSVVGLIRKILLPHT